MPWTPLPQSQPSLTDEQACNGTRPLSLNTPSMGVTSNVPMPPHTPLPSIVAPLPCLSNDHSSPGPSSIIAVHQPPSPQLLSAPPSPASSPLAFSANDPLLAQTPSQRFEVSSSSQHPHKKSCPVQGCQQLIAPTMWRQHMTLHAQGFFSGAVPGPWLQEQDLLVCPNCQQLVANSHHSSHLRKCSHASTAPPIQSLLHVQGADPPVTLPKFDSVCKLPGRTVRHIPVKDRLAFALALCSALRSALHDNSEDAWLKVFMLPKCVLLAPKRGGRHHKPVPISHLCAQWSKGEFGALWNQAFNHHSSGPHPTSNHKSSTVQTAVSLAREGLLSKACQVLTSSGLGPQQQYHMESPGLKASQRHPPNSSHSTSLSCPLPSTRL